jgi:hypothetical protein
MKMILENLRELFDKDWAWQLRKTEDNSYIIRFPPSRKVENLVIGKASQFQLNRPKVVASLSVWNGDIEPIGSLTEVWVQIKGIPPKWVDWHTVREVASSIGLMVEVDWHTLFNSFFNTVRVKVQCKNPTKVPRKRIFVFKGSLYLIRFKTEDFVQIENPSDDDKDPDAGVEELENDDDDLLGDNPKDTPKENGENSKNGEDNGSKRGKEVPTTKVDQGGKSTLGGSKSANLPRRLSCLKMMIPKKIRNV